EAVERVSEAARPVSGDEGDGPLPAARGVARPGRIPWLNDDEAGAILRVVLDRLREHVQAVPRRGGLARDRGRAGLPLLGHRPRRAGRVVERDRADLARMEVAVALGERLRMREG